MKKLFVILLFFVSLTLGAANYYIRTDGNNGNSGLVNSAGGAWRTLYYACQNTVSGDVINVAANSTFLETSQCRLKAGVSIAGAGNTSIIQSTYTSTANWVNNPIILCRPPTDVEGEVGNQSIHDLKFDGRNTASQVAISVRMRGTVEIYNCTFENFFSAAVAFFGAIQSWPTDPITEGTYAEGNKYHHNTSINCSGVDPAEPWLGTGHLFLQGQKDLLIYNNDMIQGSRAAGYNGECIRGIDGYFKGMKIYNNTMTQTYYSNEVGFSIELWYPRGGLEIYGNTISLCVDIARGVIKGEYAFAAKVYNNIIGPATGTDYTYGLLLEWDNDEVHVYKNTFRNLVMGIVISSEHVKTLQNIYIYYNIFNGIYYPGDGAIFFYTVETAICTFTNIHIYNNTIYNKLGSGARSGVGLPKYGTCSNFFIKNNIITNSYIGAIWGRDTYATMNNLVITNNVFFNNAGNNLPVYERNYSSKITNYTYSSNKSGLDPYFVYVDTANFRLNNNSSAINAGIHLPYSFITTDFDGVTISSPPEAGAFESGVTIPAVVPTVTTTAITDILLTTATGGGNVLDDGGASVTARGVVWDIATGPTLADSFTSNGSGLGTFTSSLTGLTQNTTYYVKSYATNSAGTAYGNEVTFDTGPPEQAEVATGTPIRLTDSTATGSGNVISAGGGTITARGVCWSISADPTLADNFATASTGGLGEFTAAMTGLLPTIYYVRAWATNETTTVYGLNVIFDMREGQLLRGPGNVLMRDANGNLIRVR